MDVDIEEPDWEILAGMGSGSEAGLKAAGIDDFDEAVETWKYLFMKNCDAQFWVGAAWNRVKEAELVQWLLDAGLPWKLNVQVHKYIWPANERGV